MGHPALWVSHFVKVIKPSDGTPLLFFFFFFKDNLSVFLRGCEELGLKGSQLFDPGDLQDTSIRANLK